MQKTFAPRDMIATGILQEANRRFFHPLGLALMVTFDDADPNNAGAITILDSRNDPEGFVFADLDTAEAVLKRESVEQLAHSFVPARSTMFPPDTTTGSFYVQPVGSKLPS